MVIHAGTPYDTRYSVCLGYRRDTTGNWFRSTQFTPRLYKACISDRRNIIRYGISAPRDGCQMSKYIHTYILAVAARHKIRGSLWDDCFACTCGVACFVARSRGFIVCIIDFGVVYSVLQDTSLMFTILRCMLRW